ncbi:hypothetical protein LTR36_003588 [Oleoguttula mirabilis]|uniref:Poly(A) RNA polymerase mitochondrial-like central palm domain-containing protein n=1 Tax=Oleoguttula mirabilis TaxID=1507867 RepID=A0AAV9JIQ9_9PEZI|nr:hypothetical protein LTR36_003588 [Oleoguttula mirabilis]
MQSSHLALRQSCRAHNAYNVTTALASAFSTASRRGQEAAAAAPQEGDGLRHGNTRQAAAADTGAGSYASYESLSNQFRRPGRSSTSTGAAQTERKPPTERSLSARQALVDGESESESGGGGGGGGGAAPPPIRFFGAGHMDGAKRAAVRLRKSEAASKTAKASERTPKAPSEKRHEDWRAHMQWIGRSVNQASRGGKAPAKLDKLRERVDYEGIALQPRQPTTRLNLPMPWALGQSEVADHSVMERLDQEIVRFAAYMEPTPAEKAARQAVVAEACAMIQRTLGDTDVHTELFGSSKTGLALATSDIDIRLYTASPTGAQTTPADLGATMTDLYRHMDASLDWICCVFRNAHYPIINAQHRATGLDLQIVSSPSTAAQQACTAQYLAELPHLRTLYPLVRTLLGTRGLVEVFNGGIGSYGLLMMLVAALTRRRSPAHPLPPTAAEQFLHFLHFYTRDFDPSQQGLTISPVSKPFLKHHPAQLTPAALKQHIEAAHRRHDPVRAGQWAISQTRPLQPYLLCLQDPANPTNDLGRKTNAIKHIVAVLAHVRRGVEFDVRRATSRRWKKMQRKEEENRGDDGKEEGVEEGEDETAGMESLLWCPVRRCHEVYAARRGRVEGYGRGFLEEEGQGVGVGGEGELVQ